MFILYKLFVYIYKDKVPTTSSWQHACPKAARQAVDACMKNISLEEYAKTHKELKVALEYWGYFRPRA